VIPRNGTTRYGEGSGLAAFDVPLLDFAFEHASAVKGGEHFGNAEFEKQGINYTCSFDLT
jgi:hypothetical protein